MISLRRKSSLLVALFAFGLTIFSTGLLFAPIDEGCTPGFWKMLAKKDPNLFLTLTGHMPSETIGLCPVPTPPIPGIFIFGTQIADSWWTEIQCATLEEALKFHGGRNLAGAVRIFLRHAVAGYLNSMAWERGYIHYWSPGYFSEWIMQDVLIWGETRDDFLDIAYLIDEDNNLGCPLDRWGRRMWPYPINGY